MNTYGYVGGNPLISMDPKGLVRWKGTYRTYSLIIVFGAAYFDFKLTSECVDGKQASVYVIAVGPGTGIGLAATTSGDEIEFEDNSSTLNPDVFNGDFAYYGISGAIGNYGWSLGIVALGQAGNPVSPFGSPVGFDFSYSLIYGSSTVWSYSIKDCGC